MVSKELKSLLERLNLLSNKAVFFPSENNGKFLFSSEIRFKLDLIKPDAFYVFNNQPFILFFDLAKNTSISREDEIHKQVWSFDYAPVVFVVKVNSIEIYNAFHYEKEKNRLKKLDIAESEFDAIFSFWQLETGETWKWLQENEYKKYRDGINKKRVNQRLFENIKEVRLSLESNGLATSFANTIILRLIFIRYLIDREVTIPKTYISGSSVEECRKSFSDLILKPTELNAFFEYLNERFNGALFKQNPTLTLSTKQAKYLSDIFDSRKDKTDNILFDKFYFDIFDFSIIPVEVISGIYESVIDPEIKTKDSAIYTPPFLVEHILANTIDIAIDNLKKKEKKVEFKILDPSCGSGIFLVQSYRRMVDEEIKRGNGEPLESRRLREIAENNLFGIDLNEQSLLVASFSIYIALLDYKDPKAINNFKFPELLGKNLFAANFFDEGHIYNSVLSKISFDFILGNPPWKSKKDDAIHTNYISKHNLTIGRYEIAQTFLIRTNTFMSLKTKAALIVTSTIFFNVSETTKSFKKNFLTQNCIDLFFDLSAVRRLIFEDKNSPAAAVFYRVSENNEHLHNRVRHISVKSNIFLKYYKAIVIEKFDQKLILQKHFIDYDWMFKLALYGNTLDYNLIKRLEKITVKIKDIVSKDGFAKGDGIYKGSPKNTFDFLLNKPVIETEEIQPYYTHIPRNIKRLTEDDIFLESGRKEKLFHGNSILIKHRAKDETDLVFSYTDKSVVFRHGTYGITGNSNTDDLKLLYAYCISNLFTYYQFLTSSAWGIATRPEVKLEEHLSFPFKAANDKTQTDIIKTVNAFIATIKEWYKEFNLGSPEYSSEKLDDINRIIDEVYNITSVEQDLIDYVLNVSRYQFQENKQKLLLRKINHDTEILVKYVEAFKSEFANIYSEENLHADIYPLNNFIAIVFSYSKNKTKGKDINIIDKDTDEKTVLNVISEKLSIWDIVSSSNAEKNLFVQKDIKGFEKNCFYIIKPNEYKCWHRAVAWYDISEIKNAIEMAEIELLNTNNDRVS